MALELEKRESRREVIMLYIGSKKKKSSMKPFYLISKPNTTEQQRENDA